MATSAERSIDYDGVNEQALKKYGVEVYDDRTSLIDVECDTEEHIVEEKPVMLVCEHSFKQGHAVHTEALATTVDGEFRGYRIQLPGRERKWVVLQGEEPSMHKEIEYITVGFVDAEGNPSPDLRCIVVDSPKVMARLNLEPSMPMPIASAVSPSVNNDPRMSMPMDATKASEVAKSTKHVRRPVPRAARKSMPGRDIRLVIFDSSDDSDGHSDATSKVETSKARECDDTLSQSPRMQTRSADPKLRRPSSFDNYTQLAGQKRRPQHTLGGQTTPKRARTTGGGVNISSADSGTPLNVSEKVDQTSPVAEASITSNEKAISEGKKELEALRARIQEKQAQQLAQQQREKADLERLLATYE